MKPRTDYPYRGLVVWNGQRYRLFATSWTGQINRGSLTRADIHSVDRLRSSGRSGDQQADAVLQSRIPHRDELEP